MTDIIPTPECCNCGTSEAHMYHNAGGGRFACHECWTVGELVTP